MKVSAILVAMLAAAGLTLAAATVECSAAQTGGRKASSGANKATPASKPPGPGWVRLFDGKTLKGWEGDRKIFRVEDGAIVGGSLHHRIAHNNFLCTKKSYGNFELRLKFKLLGKEANGGVQIRSRRVPHSFEVSGYQADMGQRYYGSLYDESRRRRTLAWPNARELAKHFKRGQWANYRILCQGRHIQLWINGYPTVDYTEKDPKIKQTGLIGLQIHAGQPAEAWYKDIYLRKLK